MRVITSPRTCVLLLASACACASALAAGPQVRSQAPGYYRMMLGDFEITALNDGVFGLNTRERLTHTDHVPVDDLLARSFEGEIVATSVNAYLVNTVDHLVLVDTGAADLFGPTLGHLMSNLSAAGYRPEQVDTILLTHMHPDHVGGLMEAGMAAFPNSNVYAARDEVEFWLGSHGREDLSDETKAFFDGVAASVGRYAITGRLKAFTGTEEIVPGIRPVEAPGHTPGHTMYQVESKSRRLLVWGDLTEIVSIQFAEPAVNANFDIDQAKASAGRAIWYANAARDGYLVAGAHLPFPGIGHVRREPVGYSWWPVDYDAVR